MRFAQATPAIDEERVVGMTRALRDGEGCGVRQPVVRADDEGRERVARIEDRGDRRALSAALGWGRDRGDRRGRSALILAGISGIRRPLTGAGRGPGAPWDGDEAHVDGAADQPLERGAD